MKRVGILTMHKVENVGSALQAYALQRVVESLGYQCELIDYLYPTTEHLAYQNRIIQVQQLSILELIICLLRKIKATLRKKTDNPFEKFYKDNFHCSKQSFDNRLKLMSDSPSYDIYISGSDQVWNPQYIGFDTSFFLDFAPEGARRISYASSFTISKLPIEFTKAYKGELMKFDRISVRERSGVNIVKELTGKNSENVCDPTFLLNAEQWAELAEQSMFKTDEHYILVYLMAYAYNPYPDVYDYIERVYKQLNLPVVFFNTQVERKYNFREIHVSIKGPNEFLYLFSNADYVITDSFHGTAFSLIFQKPFISCIQCREAVDSRVIDLLGEVGGINHTVVYNEDNEIPFSDLEKSVKDKVDRYRMKSVAYLAKSLKDE